MKKLLYPLFLVCLLVTPACKVEMNSSISSGAVTWTATKDGSFASFSSFNGKEAQVQIQTVDYALTVNGKSYGKVTDGAEIKVEEGKVYINGSEVSPVDSVK